MQSEKDESADRELIARTAEGESECFAQLVDRHQERMFRFLLRLSPSASAAEDALQETFLSAFGGAAGFSGGSSVRTWLFGIAYRQAARLTRRRSGEPNQFEPLDALGRLAGFGDPATPEEIAGRVRLSGCVDAALRTLDEDDQTILLLRDAEGLSGPEVCEILNLGTEAMKSRLHRARLKLVAAIRKGRCTDGY